MTLHIDGSTSIKSPMRKLQALPISTVYPISLLLTNISWYPTDVSNVSDIIFISIIIIAALILIAFVKKIMFLSQILYKVKSSDMSVN